MNRRECLGLAVRLLAAGSVLGAAPPRVCRGIEGRRVRWLVGWSPGGGYDTYSRLLEPPLEHELGTEIVIENLPGAGGLVAARRISAARPDGRTLGIANGTGLMISPFSNPGFAPDLEADFTILGRIARHRQALFVPEADGVAAIEELVAIGRDRPLILAETGPGTVNLLLGALLEDLFGVRVDHVLGFPGSSEVKDALRRGYADAAVVSEETVRPDEGLVPILRFARSHDLPETALADVRSLSGPAGLAETRPDLFVDPARARTDAAAIHRLTDVGRVIVGPPGIPRALAVCIEAGVAEALGLPDLRDAAARTGRTLEPASSREVRRSVATARDALPRFEVAVRRAIARLRG